ncbi:NAD(P)-binding protein [Xylariaceae sp. FL0594]|nr:NAD(P)-binding protein [Xylariaceae sp. FL0594]
MPPPRGTPNFLEGPGDYDTTTVVHSDTYPAIDPTKADLSGRAVFVSGASRGIGRRICISFALAGASMIAIGGRSSLTETAQAMKKAAVEAGRPEPRVLELSVDVTDRGSVNAAAARIRKEFGRIDVVVNNAGLLTGFGPLADSDPDGWWETMTVNVKGPYLVARALLPLMLETGGVEGGGPEAGLKTFVTVASVAVHLRTPGASAYQTSKLAALRLTEFIDAEYAGKGVVAFSVHPGNIVTDMTDNPDFPMQEDLVPVFVDTVELAGDSIVYLTAKRREWLGGRYINLTWDLPELMSMEQEIVKDDKLKLRMVL